MAGQDRQGGCNCGAVRLTMRGEPLRVGLCHCLTCRRDSGAPFMAYAVWPSAQVTVQGETRCWADRYARHFCPECGSRVFGAEGGEIEVRLGALDAAPSGLTPTYELWVVRREPWLRPVPGAEQFQRDRV